ncbi:hypothetical protein ACFQ3Z_11590 [Streptomyces nogalater]
MAALVGGSVTIEDTESRVLAHSSTQENVDEMRRLTILGRRVPAWRVAAMRDAGFFRALWTTDDVLHRRAQGDNPERLVCAVRAGGEVLGSVWVAAVAGGRCPRTRPRRCAPRPGPPPRICSTTARAARTAGWWRTRRAPCWRSAARPRCWPSGPRCRPGALRGAGGGRGDRGAGGGR